MMSAKRQGRKNELEEGFNEEDYLRSSHKASRKPLTANHLLSFNVERKTQTPNSRSRDRYYIPKQSITHSPEQFFQANFQFVVQQDFIHEQDPDQTIKWEQVKIVICHEESLQELSKCPICLDPPHAPRITKCGHIFCFTCLLRMFQATLETQESTKRVDIEGNVSLEVDQRYKQCPLCTEMIALHLLKPVKVLIEPIHYTENSSCEFVLLRRHNSSLVTQSVEEYLPSYEYILPEHNRSYSKFCRFHTDADHKVIRELLNFELAELLQLKESAASDELRFIELAIHQLEEYFKSCESLTSNKETKQKQDSIHPCNDKEDNYIYSYQEQSGQKLFVHPLSSRAILNQYGSYTFAPTRIKSRIMEIEEITVDTQARKRYKFLSHLPLGSVCRICELDMRSLVSRDALAPLLPKIKKRIALRRQKKQDEDRAEQKRKKAQRYTGADNIEINMDDFESLSSFALRNSSDFIDPEPQIEVEAIQAPVWVKEDYYRPVRIPKKLVAAPTSVRKVKGSDGESDEELAAPSYAASVYADISFDEFPVKNSEVKEESVKPQKGKGRQRKQRKKQMLFSTSQISYS